MHTHQAHATTRLFLCSYGEAEDDNDATSEHTMDYDSVTSQQKRLQQGKAEQRREEHTRQSVWREATQTCRVFHTTRLFIMMIVERRLRSLDRLASPALFAAATLLLLAPLLSTLATLATTPTGLRHLLLREPHRLLHDAQPPTICQATAV